MAAPHARHSIVLASNRGPVSFRVGDGGSLLARRGGGGLVTALGGLARHHDVTWVAHAMGDGDVAAADAAAGEAFAEVSRGGSEYRLRLVGAPDTAYRMYYNTIANPLLWFVQHRLYGFGWDPTIDRHMHTAFRAYRSVNERLATAMCEEIEGALATGVESPVAMVQDYHLFLVPGLVRQRCPDVFLQFFLHIPWPEPGAWRCVPAEWVNDFARSLLACDVVGMQTSRDVANLLRACRRWLGAEIDHDAGTIRLGDAVTHVRAYPISVACDEFAEHVRTATVQRLRRSIAAMRPEDGTLIVRVDRTDPSKNIVRGLAAYRLLLREHPELHHRVAMFCQLDPSRQDISEYVRYLQEITSAAEEINRTFGTGSWQPLHLNLDSNFQAAVAAYLEYDVLFVNPVADGMNLVSKEGPLVNERDGAVVLSEQAGSFMELGAWVHAVNPFDVAQQADALHQAITADLDVRAVRAEAIREQVRAHDVYGWVDHQLADIEQLGSGEAAS